MLIRNPMMLPANIKEILLNEERSIVIATYDEPNKYYVTLSGKPFKGNKDIPADKILMIPDDFYDKYSSDAAILRAQPIHELPLKYQELFMNSEYYEEYLKKYPECLYLKYIGGNSIPIEISRRARDGDIMNINTNKLNTYHPIYGNVTVDSTIVHAFSNIYRSTRNYVYQTLRGDFSDIYPNYNDLIRFLTIYMSIGASINEFQKKSSKLIYMNNVTANNLFMLYGLPSVIMEGTPMIEFLKKFRLLLMDKGTNIVYRVKDLIGYQDTDIYTLVMVKQQVFEEGKPVYHYGENGERTPVSRIVFRRLGTTDDNTSYFKFRESKKEYDWKDIADGDPRWWNDSTTEAMLQDMNYTLSNSKYIQLSTHMSMTDIWWQCVIFLRGLLDRRQETQTTLLSINRDINGSSNMTVYDAVLSLIIMMQWQLVDFNGNTMDGDMYIPINGAQHCVDMLFNGLRADGSPMPLKEGRPFKIASFNFNVRTTNRKEYDALRTYDYLNPDYFIPMLDNILNMSSNNVGEVLMNNVKLVYKYLEEKVRTSRTIQQFRQATDAYNLLFMVDPIRDWFDNSKIESDSLLCEKYAMKPIDLEQLKYFFLSKQSPMATEIDYIEIKYNNKTYKIYLYDILNNNVYYMMIDGEYLFRNHTFVGLFEAKMMLFDTARDNKVRRSMLSAVVKENDQRIIVDKINIDLGSSIYGPTSFENLLMMENPTLYEYMLQQRADNNDNIVSMLRALIKGLEQYTNTSLAALESKALGTEEYFRILKEVITYFKSYMIEFTKDEFTYIMGGLFDNGGNSDMLKLFDEMSNGSIEITPPDSLTMYDVSHSDLSFNFADDNKGFIYDEAIFRLKAPYKNVKETGYELWFDTGKRISRNPFDIDDDTEVMANIVRNKNYVPKTKPQIDITIDDDPDAVGKLVILNLIDESKQFVDTFDEVTTILNEDPTGEYKVYAGPEWEGPVSIATTQFQDVKSLKYFEIPQCVTSINDYAFRSAGIKKIGIHNKITWMGQGVCFACMDLETVVVDAGGESGFIGEQFAAYCTNLKEVNIIHAPWIMASAFENTTMEEIEIPESTVTIQENAFKSCPNLKKVIFHGSTSPLENSFAGCPSLKIVSVEKPLIVDQHIFGPLETGDNTSGTTFYINAKPEEMPYDPWGCEDATVLWETKYVEPSDEYKIIINKNNLDVIPPNYYGNTR